MTCPIPCTRLYVGAKAAAAVSGDPGLGTRYASGVGGLLPGDARAPAVVHLSPPLDEHPGNLQRVEDLPFQHLVAQPAIEALDVPVPWTASWAGSHGLPG